MASSPSSTPRYYIGMFDLGTTPDYERAARTFELLRANGVAVEPAPAIEQDNAIHLPFFTKATETDLAISRETRDPRPTIEALSAFKLSAYAKVDPRSVGSDTMDVLARLSRHDPPPVRARELRPRPHGQACLETVFDGLVGLRRQQDALRKIGTLVAKHGREAAGCLHMAFVGAPGTGKTELARRLLGYFDALGITSGKGVFVQAGAADLVGRYVGTTAPRTRAVVERARGGVLFIDEAYALMDASSYGQEAIDTLVETLEDLRHELVCVIAGYPEQIEQLFARNPGLRDRFGLRLAFDDYDPDELACIFEGMAGARGFSVAPDAREEARRCLARMRAARDFANARSARRLLERCLLEAATARDEPRIEASDVRAAYEQPDLGAVPSARVGFGA